MVIYDYLSYSFCSSVSFPQTKAEGGGLGVVTKSRERHQTVCHLARPFGAEVVALRLSTLDHSLERLLMAVTLCLSLSLSTLEFSDFLHLDDGALHRAQRLQSKSSR